MLVRNSERSRKLFEKLEGMAGMEWVRARGVLNSLVLDLA